MIVLPHINPVLLDLGILQIRWYGMMYVLGFLIAWFLGRNETVRRIDGKSLPLNTSIWADLISYLATSIVVGGRLGYVCFYKPGYYFDNVGRIFAIWEGGMSFHGALIGFSVGLYLFSKHFKICFQSLIDVVCPLVAPGLAFGRLGNFINGELIGRVSDVPWAMVFPHSDLLPRHPSQLYEMLGEGGLLYLLMAWHKSHSNRVPGSLGPYFIFHYGWIRFLLEFYREPDFGVGFVWLHIFTMGQVLCLFMLLIAVVWMYFLRYKFSNSSTPLVT